MTNQVRQVRRAALGLPAVALLWLTTSLLLGACTQIIRTPVAMAPAQAAASATSSRPTKKVSSPEPALTATGVPSPAPTSRPSVSPSTAPVTEPTPLNQSGTEGGTPAGQTSLPALLDRVTLAPAGAGLTDFLLDASAGRLYVTDSGSQLHVLDAGTHEVRAVLPAMGSLTLDANHDRLYISPGDDEGDVTVVDTDSLSVVGNVSPGGFVAVDSTRDRFYVGNRVHGPSSASTASGDPAGVRVYDGATLEQVGEVPQPGIPVYNRLRDELYIIAYTIFAADPEALEVTGDLLPEITEQPLAWCNGCLAATGAYVYPDRNLFVAEVTILSAGKGPGLLPPPRTFDATTLQEITDLSRVPSLERGCGERPILAEPVDDRVYRDKHYSRYVTYSNFLVYDLDGGLETWRGGLALGITNPNTGQMYVPHGDDTLVMDLATISPLGAILPTGGDAHACIHTLDSRTGRVYVLSDRDLVVLSEEGGQPGLPPPKKVGVLPTEQILSIQPSPAFASDQTLFLTTPGKVYRSSDGGQAWVQLRGGLPEGYYLTIDLAISPDFSLDSTLFVGGFRGDFWGEGVYRSTDGGDRWQPMWSNLRHLRVYDVAVSPNYAGDSTLLAYSRYQRLDPWQGGQSIFRSADQGLSWTMVMTRPGDTALPSPEELLPAAPAAAAVQFQEAEYGQAVERTDDGGRTWESTVVSRQPDFYVQAIVSSPTYAADQTVYVLSEFDLFRSTDGGQTWSRWIDERLAGRDYSNKLTTLAVSPPLGGGDHQLFVGTMAGEFWVLEPEALEWEQVYVAEQWATVLEGEWVREIEPAIGGDVWLGTWGSGLAHFADGRVQARYTVTDGLPTQYLGAIALASDGTLWVGGDLPSTVASFDGHAWTSRPFAEEDAVGTVFDLTAGPDGRIWAGAQAPGLLRWQDSSWQLIPDREGVTGGRIYDIDFDDRQVLWSATARGLMFNVNGLWHGEGGGEVKDVEFGTDGAVYVLAAKGVVWRYNGQDWTELPSPQDLPYLQAQTLHVAADGAVWMGTPDGAFRYDGLGWRQFTAQDGLPANDVSAITQGADGWLWFGTEKGAARVNPATLDLSGVFWPMPPAQEPPSQVVPPAPSATPRVTSTPGAAPQITPTPCAPSPAEPFAAAYAAGETSVQLGCPKRGLVSTNAAFQPFEHGVMLWRADERAIYVLYEDGTWARYVDTYDDAQPHDDPFLVPAAGLHEPVRGFGKLWREQLGGPQSSLGWALADEEGYVILAQPFDAGQMFLGPNGEVLVLYDSGTWESRK